MGSLSVWPTSFVWPTSSFFGQQSNRKLIYRLNVYKHSVDACKTENQDNFEKRNWYVMPRLNETDRWRAIGMIEAGVFHTDVARQLDVHRNTVDALWRRYQQFGTTRDRLRSGRPHVTSNHQDTYIRVVHLRDQFRTATLTARSIPGLRRISPRTIRNRLHERGIRPWRPAIRPVLQQCHRVARFACCRWHIHFMQQDWARVLFMDESRFHLDSSDGRSRVYRRVGERFHYSCVIQRRPFGGDSVIVWGGISSRGRTALVVVDGTLTGIRYRDEIIRPHVLPFVQQHSATLQQDNVRQHVALVVIDFLIQNNVNVLPWPAMSPD